jgi:hypothetical protein
MRYGVLGADSLWVASQLSIGHGTVFLYCRRVMKALRQLRPKFVSWPNDSRKEEIKVAIEEKNGFRMCLGSGDGCLIPFMEEPAQYGYMYMSRKKFHGVCAIIIDNVPKIPDIH